MSITMPKNAMTVEAVRKAWTWLLDLVAIDADEFESRYVADLQYRDCKL